MQIISIQVILVMGLGVVPSTLVDVCINIHLCRYLPILFSSSHIVSGLSAGIIAGIVIAAFVGFVCCVLIFIALPICICCCLGVGIGAAAGRGGNRYTYSNI